MAERGREPATTATFYFKTREWNGLVVHVAHHFAGERGERAKQHRWDGGRRWQSYAGKGQNVSIVFIVMVHTPTTIIGDVSLTAAAERGTDWGSGYSTGFPASGTKCSKVFSISSRNRLF